MTLLDLFRRQPPDPYQDPQLPLQVNWKAAAEATAARPQFDAVEFGSKPMELVAAVNAAADWTRPAARPIAPVAREPESLELPWTRDLPGRPGVYWHAPHAEDMESLELLVVIRFGQQLCVRQHKGDARSYVGVARLGGWWAGPGQTPQGIELEELSFS